MLIDYVSPEKLPGIIVWLDWNFYAYRLSFFMCVLITFLYHIYEYGWVYPPTTVFFIGFCLWCVFIYLKVGTAVG